MVKKILISMFLLICNLSLGQEKDVEKKDSLFFHLDKKLLIQNKFENDYFYLQGNLSSTFAFFVVERRMRVELKPEICQSFSEFLFKKYGDNKIDSGELSSELRKFKIFLCDCKYNKRLIEVYPVTIEE
ncbi:hypothetical protein [Gillisia xinjiangensis]|uniref:hypothetical protein n=1 Tax=Gillisia xinjiangensis TaxID=3384765 RepID=UPI0039196423